MYGNGFGGTVTIVDQQQQQRRDNNAILVKEPGFSQVSGTSVTHGFYVGSTTTNNNPPYPSNYQYLTLKFDFDMFAHEVAYEIKNDYDNVIFALAWFQTYETNTPNAKIRIPIYGSEKGDQTYTLRIWDSGNDGICCSWGNGGYELYLGDPDDTTGGFLLKRGSGDYGSKETFQFLIEGDGPPSSMPTYNPTSRRPTLTPVAVKLDASSVDTTLSPTIDYSSSEEATYIFEASSVAIPRPAYVDGTKPASNDIKFSGDNTTEEEEEEAQPSIVLSTNDDTENDGGIIFAPESNVDDTLSSTGMSSRKKNLVGGHAIE